MKAKSCIPIEDIKKIIADRMCSIIKSKMPPEKKQNLIVEYAMLVFSMGYMSSHKETKSSNKHKNIMSYFEISISFGFSILVYIANNLNFEKMSRKRTKNLCNLVLKLVDDLFLFGVKHKIFVGGGGK